MFIYLEWVVFLLNDCRMLDPTISESGGSVHERVDAMKASRKLELVAILIGFFSTACAPTPSEGPPTRNRTPSQGVDQEEIPSSKLIERQRDIVNQEYVTSQWEGFLSSGRDSIYHPERVLEVLGIEPGMVIGDIGAGSGYFTFRFARAVGKDGKVFAIDTQPEGLDYIRRTLDGELGQQMANVDLVVSRYDDICLPEAKLDLGFMSEVHFHSYSELIPESRAMIASTYRALKPGGRLAIIERKNKPVRTSVEIIAANYGEAGFELVETYDFIEPCLFLVLQKPE